MVASPKEARSREHAPYVVRTPCRKARPRFSWQAGNRGRDSARGDGGSRCRPHHDRYCHRHVHVAGCVASPGVVELQEGARVDDAVAAAGGFSPDAAEDAVNLARVVKDGEQVYIPSTDQALSDSAEQGPGWEAQAGQTATGGQAALVNINTAGSTELQSLPGIGPSTAAKIVDYRNANGSFSACEDLKNVSGIGDKKYEAIEGLICV